MTTHSMRLVSINLALLLLLCTSAIAIQEYTLTSDLDIDLTYTGHFNIDANGQNPSISKISSEVKLIPQTTPNQQIINLETTGKQTDSQITYTWTTHSLGAYDFGYTSTIHTTPQESNIKKKITFPLNNDDTNQYRQFLQPSTSIDSDNPKIKKAALEIAQGEDDLFLVATKTADFVQANVVYDLNSLTEKASQKASWVLDNKVGVCDEMTSLFIAMMRSLGVPARFVSGVSYTTSPLFSSPWQPHGWAEVYFPGQGWIPFDIAFGQFGYTDATHIRLYTGLDPTDNVVFYEWIGNNVDLKEKPSTFDVNIKRVGTDTTDNVDLKVSPLATKVGFGSYNKIEVIATNKNNAYAARTIRLGIPSEIEVIGPKTKSVLIEPNKQAKVTFLIKVPENLRPDYTYSFPITVVSERNTTATSVFTSQSKAAFFTYDQIKSEETVANAKQFAIECTAPEKVHVNGKATMSCSFNRLFASGIADLCIGKICEEKELTESQTHQLEINLDTKDAGVHTILASASGTNTKNKEYLSVDYIVYDEPGIAITATAPEQVKLGDSFTVKIALSKTSVQTPKNIKVRLTNGQFTQSWDINELSNQQNLQLTLDDFPLSKTNTIMIDAFWKDEEQRGYTNTTTITITGQASGIWQKIMLLINGII